MDAPAKSHPSAQTLSSFGLGKLDDASTAEVDRHLQQCLDCRKRVAELSADSFLVLVRDAKQPAAQSAWPRSQAGGEQSENGANTSAPPPGLLAHPDYTITRELGRGGMGVVYLAENTLMGRTEVLKMVSGQLLGRPGVLDRFLREIRSAAKLRHANIVTAYAAHRIGEGFVLAMEYVDGLDLANLVKAKGPLPVAQACGLALQAALGLQHAHEHGMVHRDIKPANLILSHDGTRGLIKILDFGLAKVTSEGQVDSGLTREGQMLGTPDFISPEQIRDAQSADIRADIYSLGCTLYYLLSGRPPFTADSLWDLYQAHFSMDAGPLNLLRPEVSGELDALVAKMMAKDPAKRFQTPGEVAAALAMFVNNEDGSSNRKLIRQGRLAWTTAAAKLHWLRPRPRWSIAGVLLLGVVITSVLIFRTKSGTIVFENLPEKAVVTVDGDAFTVEWPQSKGNGRAQITIPPGKHSVEVKLDGVRVTGEEVSVDSGGVTPFIVRIDRPPGIALSPTARTGSSDPAPKRVKNSVGMTLVLIPPGDFQMGSDYGPPGEDDRPPHLVRISRPYYLGAYEVTQEQYETVMKKNPSHFSGRPKNPVDDVTWIDTVMFCNELSRRESLSPYYEIVGPNHVSILGGKGYRLPTEAEWEYACRAGNSSNMPFHDNGHLGRFAWMYSNCDRMTQPVGAKEPNGFGLFDIYGNVWEWCWDWLGPYPAGLATDPSGPMVGTYRVLHGNGWWNGDPGSCRPSFRLRGLPEKTSPNHDFGFRVAAGGPDGLPVIPPESSAGTHVGHARTPQVPKHGGVADITHSLPVMTVFRYPDTSGVYYRSATRR
jgi:serine/threonine protein kinase/formylglycine-generating enzyme required for sulfatase activity